MCWCPALPWSQVLLTDSDPWWPGCHGPAAGAGGSDGGGAAPGPGFPRGQVRGRGNPPDFNPSTGSGAAGSGVGWKEISRGMPAPSGGS